MIIIDTTQTNLVKNIGETIEENKRFFSEDYIKNILNSITDVVEI